VAFEPVLVELARLFALETDPVTLVPITRTEVGRDHRYAARRAYRWAFIFHEPSMPPG
jgi:hypothetical protein